VIFSEKTYKPILDSVRRGNFLNTAVASCGLSYRTVLKWREKGRAGIEPYVKFYQELKEAEAFFESYLLENIVSSGDPKMHLQILARRNSENWAEVEKIKRTVDAQIEDFLEYLMGELEPYPEAKHLVVGISSRYESRHDAKPDQGDD
jgi:hypothetical protein